MTNSDEPVPKKESFDDDLNNLTRLSRKQILDLAKGKNGKRDEGYRFEGFGSKWADLCGCLWTVALTILVSFITGMLFIGPMLVDPLFLYVPIIHENIKCLALDEELKKIAIVWRLFTDLPFLLQIIRHVLRRWCTLRIPEDLDKLIPRSPIYNILAVLPIPQIVILIFLLTTRNLKSLNRMKLLNSLILLQYVARVYPTYIVCTEINSLTRENSNEFAKQKKIWLTGALNFFMYFLASHVLGAFWYFFSIQREIDCWISTCRSENGCNLSTLQCDNTTFRNVTLLNDLCPTNPPNQTVYDFGIFVGTLQYGIVGTTNFSKKLLICFSWGLRNLSSFASNLNTSTYAWESVFVIFISISGLLLFTYLLGHMQTFMQAVSQKSNIRQRIRGLCPQIKFMLSEYGLLGRGMHAAIEELVGNVLEEDEDNPVENIFSLLPSELQKHMKRHLFLATLRKVPGLVNIDRQVLETIMEHLKPVNYVDGSYIIREGEPLDRMLFITQGSVLTYKTSSVGGESGSSSIICLAKSEFYGEELVGWAAASTSFSDLPISAKTVKSRTKVEVFVLMADHLQLVVSKFRTQSNTELPQPADSTPVEISFS